MPEMEVPAALGAAICEVLDKMFFISDTEDSPDRSAVTASGFTSRLAFNGTVSGTLTLFLESAAARSIAADFLAQSPALLSDDQVSAVVCELANMICGSVLSRLEPAGTFRITSPEPVPLPIPARAHTAAHTVQLDGGTVTAHLDLEPRQWQTENASAY